MKHFMEASNGVKDKQFEVTKQGRIQQKQQTELKNSLTAALLEDFSDAGVEVYAVQKGFVALIENDEEGAIPVEITIVTKPLDYDFDALHEEWLAKQGDK